MKIIVVSRDPRTSGYKYIIDGSRPIAGSAGCDKQEAACTALSEAISHGCKLMAPKEVSELIPVEYRYGG